MESYKSRLMLYSYDSFLFDFDLDDGVDFLRETKNLKMYLYSLTPENKNHLNLKIQSL